MDQSKHKMKYVVPSFDQVIAQDTYDLCMLS